MRKNNVNNFILTGLFTLACFCSHAQLGNEIVASAVPFLRVTPDARNSGLGDGGIAASPDVYAVFRNSAKLVFAENKFGIGANYTPWLGDASDGIYLASLAGYYKLNNNQAISASLRYFNMGEIILSDPDGIRIGSSNPRELALDAGYSLRLAQKWSAGVAFRYINSKLLAGDYNGTSYSGASAFSGDVSLYYHGLKGDGGGWAGGLTLSNLGSKINYTGTNGNADFLPANLGLGISYTALTDGNGKITLLGDVNKLLVPIAPNEEASLKEYQQMGIAKSWFESFNGKGMKTSQASIGVEYGYNELLFLRGGLALDGRNRMYGDTRHYFTLGVGLKAKGVRFDFAYVAAEKGGPSGHPATNTLRFGLAYGLK